MTPSELASQSFHLRLQYPKHPGVYLIYCKADAKGYVGSSMGVYARLYGHRRLLKNNKHLNPHLQAAFNKYGLDEFLFLTVETHTEATVESLLARENHYLLQIPRELLFNMVIPAVRGGGPGIKRSDAHKAALSRAHKGHKYNVGRKHTDEWRATVSALHKQSGLKPPVMRGAANPKAKITWEIARQIRAMFLTEGGIVGQRMPKGLGSRIAAHFGLKSGVIWQICSEKTWKPEWDPEAG